MAGSKEKPQEKKKWERPVLTVLVRGKPQESVLGICKTFTGATGDTSTTFTACDVETFFPCTSCDPQTGMSS